MNDIDKKMLDNHVALNTTVEPQLEGESEWNIRFSILRATASE